MKLTPTWPDAGIVLLNIDETLAVDAVTGGQLDATLKAMGDSVQARYQTIRAPRRARQFVAVRLLLRHVLATLQAQPASTITLTENPAAAPKAQSAYGATLPCYSLSHSGAWVAVGYSRLGAVGVDIEVPRSDRPFARLTEHTFAAQDVQWWQAQTDPVAAFYQLWCLREAHFKLAQAHATDLTGYPSDRCRIAQISHLWTALVSDVPLPPAIPVLHQDWASLGLDKQ